MKLVGVIINGRPWVARLDGDLDKGLDGAEVRPIAEVDAFWADTARSLAAEPGAPVAAGEVELVPPVPAGARVICVGLNYRAHAAEGAFAVPEHPTLFGRWTASLSVGGVPAPVPADEAGLASVHLARLPKPSGAQPGEAQLEEWRRGHATLPVTAWQATRCLGAAVTSAGASCAQIGMARGQRGWKRHPEGGAARLGGLPSRPRRSERSPIRGRLATRWRV